MTSNYNENQIMYSNLFTIPFQPEVKPIAPFPFDTFFTFAGDDFLIDARDLRDLLSELARKGKH